VPTPTSRRATPAKRLCTSLQKKATSAAPKCCWNSAVISFVSSAEIQTDSSAQAPCAALTIRAAPRSIWPALPKPWQCLFLMSFKCVSRLSPNYSHKITELSPNHILSQHRGRTPASDAVFSFGGLVASISVAAQKPQLPVAVRGGVRAQFNLPPATFEPSPPPIPGLMSTATTAEDSNDEPVTQILC
jgi:hypothetical protein